MHNTSLFSISLLICVISWLLDDSHSNRCEMISNCCFDMHFMMISDVKQFMGRKELDTTERLNWTELKHLYMNLLEFCTSSLEKYVLNSSAHYLSQMVCILILIYMNLYIFWILTPFSLFDLQIFVPLSCLFILLFICLCRSFFKLI